jgi:hypothetical protein
MKRTIAARDLKVGMVLRDKHGHKATVTSVEDGIPIPFRLGGTVALGFSAHSYKTVVGEDSICDIEATS